VALRSARRARNEPPMLTFYERHPVWQAGAVTRRPKCRWLVAQWVESVVRHGPA